MKRLDLIKRKLGAIKAKNVADIVSKEVYLPFIGKLKKAKDVEKWLAVRSQVLEDAENLSEPEILERVEELSETLCEDCQEAVERKLSARPTLFSPCAKDYEAMCKIHLYRFSLGFCG